MLNPKKIWHKNLTDLSISPVRCSHFTFGNPKKSFSTVLFIHTSDYLCYLRRKQTITHLPTTRENVTALTCELQNFSSDWRFVTFFQMLEAPKRASCGLSSVALKRTGCDWNVRQAMSQQVFRVTTFCINTSFQFFFHTDHVVVRVVYHATLCWNSAHVAISRCRKPQHVHALLL